MQAAIYMDFKKDLLLIDLETTGLNVNRHEVIQLAAVLLDRKTLKEKRFFNSFIKPAKWKNRNRESMKVNGIIREQLKDSPTLKSVINKFNKLFNPKKSILSYYSGVLDIVFLQEAYRKLRKNFPFDYHYLNLWPVFYVALAKQNQLKNRKEFAGFGLEDLAKRFKIKIQGVRHDALYDCRLEAEILRRVIKRL